MYGDRTYPAAVMRKKSMVLSAASQVDLAALYMRLLGLAGKRGKLYRRVLDGVEHWQTARLVRVEAGRDYQDAAMQPPAMPVALTFVTNERTWHGNEHRIINLDGSHILDGSWSLITATPIAAGNTVITLTHGDEGDAGRAPIRDVRITVTAGSAPITALTITRTDGEVLTYTPTTGIAHILVIDTGTMQVINPDETDPYSKLGFTPDADMGVWFSLQPGDNVITVSITGGGTGSTILFDFDEAWY